MTSRPYGGLLLLVAVVAALVECLAAVAALPIHDRRLARYISIGVTLVGGAWGSAIIGVPPMNFGYVVSAETLLVATISGAIVFATAAVMKVAAAKSRVVLVRLGAVALLLWIVFCVARPFDTVLWLRPDQVERCLTRITPIGSSAEAVEGWLREKNAVVHRGMGPSSLNEMPQVKSTGSRVFLSASLGESRFIFAHTLKVYYVFDSDNKLAEIQAMNEVDGL